jgi:hypothetical protein
MAAESLLILDIFSNKPFEDADIIAALEKQFESSFVNRPTNPRVGIFGFVDDVKIDIIPSLFYKQFKELC